MERYKYHFQIEKGWMNDPNGLIEYKGKYHIFYQYYPYDNVWGPMHWGHAITEDFNTYTELEVALRPDMEYEDDGGCFSGSAIERDGKLYLFYTSVSKKYGQTQSVAISEDGIHFTKYENNPVIKTYPEDGSKDFRDPKVLKYKDEYRMVIGSIKENQGRVLLYKSRDLISWDYVGILYEPPGYDLPVECPDLFYLDNTWVLMFSIIGRKEKQAVWITGDFNGEKFTKKEEFYTEIGPDYYAPQTFMDSKNRRICIGWFYNWKKERNLDIARGALTIPREIIIRDGKILQYPIKEVLHFGKELPLNQKGNKTTISGIKVFVTPYGVKLNDIIYTGIVDDVLLFEDVKGVELFINHGEANLTYTK